MVTKSLHVMLCIFVSSPGTYNPEMKPPPKITWPMKFGSPDWAQVPCLQKRTLKAEVKRQDLCRTLYLVLSYVLRVHIQECLNEFQGVLVPLTVYVCTVCADMHMRIFLESCTVLLDF